MGLVLPKVLRPYVGAYVKKVNGRIKDKNISK